MKLFLAIAVLIANISVAQDVQIQKAYIDAEVQRIANSRAKTQSFSIQALKKVAHSIRYRYIETNKGYIKIARQFSHKKDTVLQEFYLKNSQLIYAVETITTYYPIGNTTDSITWQGTFYFSKGKLIDHVSLGHGKSEWESWNPEHEMLTALRESIRDIKRIKANPHLAR